LIPPNTPRSSSATAAVRPVCDPRWVRSAMPMTSHVRELLRDPRMRTARALPAQDADRGEKRRVRLHRGLLQSATPSLIDRDAHQPAAVLAAVKDKPFGRPQEAAVRRAGDQNGDRRHRSVCHRETECAVGKAASQGAPVQRGTHPRRRHRLCRRSRAGTDRRSVTSPLASW
jgi:hypothetical protein